MFHLEFNSLNSQKKQTSLTTNIFASLPLTFFVSVSSSLAPISSRTPRTVMMAVSSGRVGKEDRLSIVMARRKLAASVA